MSIDARKSVTDAGYIAVGLAVLGWQEAQRRGRDLRTRAEQTVECVTNRARQVPEALETGRSRAEQASRSAREQVDTRVDSARRRLADLREGRAASLGEQLRGRVEALPQKVGETVESLSARVPVARVAEQLIDGVSGPVGRIVEPVRSRVRSGAAV